jgi:hypothetical protein
MGRLTERLWRFRGSMGARVWERMMEVLGGDMAAEAIAEVIAVEEEEVVMVRRRKGGARGGREGEEALIPSCLISIDVY